MNQPSGTPHSTQSLWRPTMLGAVVVAGEAIALVLTLAPGQTGDRVVYFGLASLLIQWIALLTLSELYMIRRILERLSTLRIAWVALSILILNTWLVGAASWFSLREFGIGEGGLPGYLLRLTALSLTIGALGLAAFQNFWRARQMALLAKQAELEALQARIRPHFLFNTLNTGAALVHDQPGEAERLLADLADLFRAALAGPHDIPLADELALARRYLEIESLRFGPRLRLGWDLATPLPDILMPALSIQPLVENAIRHGVEPSATSARLDLAVKVQAGEVHIVIRNDMPPAGAATAAGHRVGLASARERIEALSRGRGRLDTGVIDGRFVATIRMPLA